MKLAWHIVHALLNLANVVLHTVGGYALTHLYRSNKSNVQFVYLINLSLTEAIGNLMQLLTTPLLNFSTRNYKVLTILLEVRYEVQLVAFSAIYVTYYMNIVYITADRFLGSLLTIRYPIYWNVRKAITLVISTWVVGTLLALGFLLLHQYAMTRKCAEMLIVYLMLIVDLIFIVFATFAYGYMFHKYNTSLTRRMQRTLDSENRSRTATNRSIETFRSSKFHIALVIIGLFFTFSAIPDLLYVIFAFSIRHRHHSIRLYVHILKAVNDILDAFTYIFMHKSVKDFLKKKLLHCRKREQLNDVHKNNVRIGLHLGEVVSNLDNALPNNGNPVFHLPGIEKNSFKARSSNGNIKHHCITSETC